MTDTFSSRDDDMVLSPKDAMLLATRQRGFGLIDDAIETLRRAAEGALDNHTLATTLAQMLAETGQREQAGRWFRHALKLAPNDLYGRLGYGTYLGETGHLDEARSVLDGVRTEARARLADASGADSDDDISDLEGFIACTEANLARASFELGDTSTARALVTPWLTHAEHWGAAHNLLADIIERDDLDPLAIAEEGLATGHVSPYMVCHLLEQALAADPCDFVALDALIARADECFDFPWRDSEPELEACFTLARQNFARAVMRGAVDPARCPQLTAMLPRRPGRPGRKVLSSLGRLRVARR